MVRFKAEEYLLKALEIEKELQIPIVHETHRRRIFWNPFQLRDLLKENSLLRSLKINLDISHWVCVVRFFIFLFL